MAEVLGIAQAECDKLGQDAIPSSAGVTVDLAASTGAGGDAEGDTLDIALYEVPPMLGEQIALLLRRASVHGRPGAALRELKLERLRELRRLIEEEGQHHADKPGYAFYMTEILDRFVAEASSDGELEVLAHQAV